MNLSTINDNRDLKTNTPDGKALRVDITNQPIHVTTQEVSNSINVYDESSSVAGLSTVTIIEYTVPVAKSLTLQKISFSGGNRAIYSVTINGDTQAKYRTYFTEYNGVLDFKDLKLETGDILRLIVENISTSIADFNGNIQGNLNNA